MARNKKKQSFPSFSRCRPHLFFCALKRIEVENADALLFSFSPLVPFEWERGRRRKERKKKRRRKKEWEREQKCLRSLTLFVPLQKIIGREVRRPPPRGKLALFCITNADRTSVRLRWKGLLHEKRRTRCRKETSKRERKKGALGKKNVQMASKKSSSFLKMSFFRGQA